MQHVWIATEMNIYEPKLEKIVGVFASLEDAQRDLSSVDDWQPTGEEHQYTDIDDVTGDPGIYRIERWDIGRTFNRR